jgi:hypothetical protein
MEKAHFVHFDTARRRRRIGIFDARQYGYV